MAAAAGAQHLRGTETLLQTVRSGRGFRPSAVQSSTIRATLVPSKPVAPFAPRRRPEGSEAMTSYQVHFAVSESRRFTRVQLLVRLVAVAALGVIGVSLGTVFGAAYLFLPIYAASRIASLGSASEYARSDGARVMRAIHWFAAVSAWAGLAVEALPAHGPDETVRVTLDASPVRASPVAALLRVLTGLLSALVLSVLGCIGTFVWIWAALSVLFTERMGEGAHRYLVGLQRWGVRLLAYQACLVDQYPPFGFADEVGAQPSGGERIVAA
jgi:hypothetical protein